MSSALSIRQLTKTYGNGFQALKGIDLDVAEGDFFALLGPNGAGKSTTIGILSTLVNKTSGSVSVFGHDLDRQPAALKRSIGVVPQEFNFNQFEKTFDIVVTQAGYYGIPPKVANERAEQSKHWRLATANASMGSVRKTPAPPLRVTMACALPVAVSYCCWMPTTSWRRVCCPGLASSCVHTPIQACGWPGT